MDPELWNSPDEAFTEKQQWRRSHPSSPGQGGSCSDWLADDPALALPPLWAAHLSCPDLSFHFGPKTLTSEACSKRQGWGRPLLAMKWPAYGLQALLPNQGLWAWVWLWVRMGPGPLAEQWFLATSSSIAPPPSPPHVTKYPQS